MKNPRGFTLVELLVVLAILAALTSVALTSVDVYEGQARYEATKRTLQNVEDAVIGPANQREPDGSPLITGFVADIGRTPNVIGGQLPELWDNPNGLLPFGIRSANDPTFVPIAVDRDPDIYVPCGWRGPYLRLGIGQTTLLDGWGNPFELFDADRTGIASGEVSILRSLGADNPTVNTAPTSDYKEELYLNLRANVNATYPAVASPINRFLASTVQVTVTDPASANTYPDPGNGVVVIRYFGPDPATGGIKVISSGDLTPTGTAAVTHPFADPAITIGPRIFRAYQGARKSDVLQVTLPAGGKSIELKLR